MGERNLDHGGEHELVYQGGSLRISVPCDVITFYENGNYRYYGSWALSSYNCYVCILQSSLRLRVSGTDELGNFQFLEPSP